MIKTFYINSDAAKYNDDEFAWLQSALLNQGILGDSDGNIGLFVKENTVPDMSILIEVGQALVEVSISGRTFKVLTDSQSEVNKSIGNNATGDDRVDAVIMRVDVDTEPDVLKTNVATLEVITGTSAVALTDGAIQTAIGSDGFYRLADIIVPDSAVSITSVDIADTRIKVKSNQSIDIQLDPGQLSQFATGIISPFAALTPPTGWLGCDGSLKDIDSYLELYNILKTDNFLYGVGIASSFTADDATEIITSNAHGLIDNDKIFLRSDDALPSGLSADTTYFVISATTNTFQVSLTEGGSAINITDTGTGVHSFYTQFKLPNLKSSLPVGLGQRIELFNFVDSDVATGTDQITIRSSGFLHTGQEIELSTDGVLPTGLTAITYYIIRVSSTVVKLATTRANANAGIVVDITDASGGGTHTLTLTLTDRSIGDTGGEENHSLTDAEMPSHKHGLAINVTGSGSGSGSGPSVGDQGIISETLDTGSDIAHNNMPPYTVVNYIIKT